MSLASQITNLSEKAKRCLYKTMFGNNTLSSLNTERTLICTNVFASSLFKCVCENKHPLRKANICKHSQHSSSYFCIVTQSEATQTYKHRKNSKTELFPIWIGGGFISSPAMLPLNRKKSTHVALGYNEPKFFFLLENSKLKNSQANYQFKALSQLRKS